MQLHDPQQAEAVAAAIDAKVKDQFEVPTETKPQKAHYRTALADLLDLIGMTRWLGFVCVGVVVVLVANSVVMAAQDRVKEHAVLADARLLRAADLLADAGRELPDQLRRRRARHGRRAWPGWRGSR